MIHEDAADSFDQERIAEADASAADCVSCGDPVEGYDSGGRGLCHNCDQARRYDEASADKLMDRARRAYLGSEFSS